MDVPKLVVRDRTGCAQPELLLLTENQRNVSLAQSFARASERAQISANSDAPPKLARQVPGLQSDLCCTVANPVLLGEQKIGAM